jgi:hypothetical protein
MFHHASEYAKAQDSNRATLMQALRRLSITAVEITYDGGGDSGSVSAIEITPAGTTPPPLKESVTIKRVMTTYQDGEYKHEVRDESVTLEEALDDFVMSSVSQHHPGWENNDGGEGTVTFDVVKDTVNLEHHEFYTETSRHAYRL